jgi:Ca2+/H+ antiporter
LRAEWLLLFGGASSALFLLFGKSWLADLSNPTWAAFLLVWLFAAILTSAFGVVRHADCLAIKLGEPFGTLILTLAVIGMEVMMVAALMLTGHPEPTMARDTMFAVVMIVLNALLGVALLAGGWRHHQQQYNLQGGVLEEVGMTPRLHRQEDAVKPRRHHDQGHGAEPRQCRRCRAGRIVREHQPRSAMFFLTMLVPLAVGPTRVVSRQSAPLVLTLAVSTLTCMTGRTNVLNGFIHLVLFAAYFILLFEA